MSEASIEPAVFRELRTTTGAEFAAELLNTFLEEGPSMLAELRAARAEGNLDRFRRAAHSLKSNASTFGAVRLATLARDLELKGLDADPERDGSALGAIDAELANVSTALRALCDG